MSDLDKISSVFNAKIDSVKTKDDLQNIKTEFFGKNGQITQQFKSLGSLDQEKRKEFASNLNKIKDDYDYIIIDCAPSLGLITLNALTASNSVIIPIQCEYFALEGLGKLLNTIKSIQKIHNPNLNIEGLLLTMYDSRLRLSNQVVEEVRKHFHNMVFKTIIQRNVTLGEAPSYGKNIIDYDSTSKGAKNYIKLAHELINNNKKG